MSYCTKKEIGLAGYLINIKYPDYHKTDGNHLVPYPEDKEAFFKALEDHDSVPDLCFLSDVYQDEDCYGAMLLTFFTDLPLSKVMKIVDMYYEKHISTYITYNNLLFIKEHIDNQ